LTTFDFFERINRWNCRPFTHKYLIIVLGAPVLVDEKTGSIVPGPHLKERLQLCNENFLQLGADFPIIVSGGAPKSYGSSGARAEGLVMKEYLTNILHVPSEFIYSETKSYHTMDNFVESKAIMDEMKLQPLNLIVITHDWHMRRARLLAEPVFADSKIEKIQYIEAVSANDLPEIPERMVTEENLCVTWVPYILKSYQASHPQFPWKSF